MFNSIWNKDVESEVLFQSYFFWSYQDSFDIISIKSK